MLRVPIGSTRKIPRFVVVEYRSKQRPVLSTMKSTTIVVLPTETLTETDLRFQGHDPQKHTTFLCMLSPWCFNSLTVSMLTRLLPDPKSTNTSLLTAPHAYTNHWLSSNDQIACLLFYVKANESFSPGASNGPSTNLAWPPFPRLWCFLHRRGEVFGFPNFVIFPPLQQLA